MVHLCQSPAYHLKMMAICFNIFLARRALPHKISPEGAGDRVGSEGFASLLLPKMWEKSIRELCPLEEAFHGEFRSQLRFYQLALPPAQPCLSPAFCLNR